MPEQRPIGTRYWTFLRYASAVTTLCFAVKLLVYGSKQWPGNLTSLVFSLLETLALWRPGTISWCFIMVVNWAGLFQVGFFGVALLGAAAGWWSLPGAALFLHHPYIDDSVTLFAIAYRIVTLFYFHRRRALFVLPHRPVVQWHWWLTGISGSMLALLYSIQHLTTDPGLP